MDQAFKRDPSITAAFKALSDEQEIVPVDRSIRAVVIGGGTGAPVSIRTLLSMGIATDAVVAMADDGGSTGILRDEANVTPPGDIRKCLAAFAKDPEDPLTQAFKYRFEFARNHSLGNLLISALEEATGSFPRAITICEDLLKAQGHVFPSTLDRITLSATTRDGRLLEGQARASHADTALRRVWLESIEQCRPYGKAMKAIQEADLIVLGPGSLFTSIIPNLLVPGITEAIKSSDAKTVFVCSLADMQGETWGLSAREHVEALLSHGMRGLLDYVVIHSAEPLRPDAVIDDMYEHTFHELGFESVNSGSSPYNSAGSMRPILLSYRDVQAIQNEGPVVIVRDLVDPQRPTWHDPIKLREALRDVIRLCHLPLM